MDAMKEFKKFGPIERLETHWKMYMATAWGGRKLLPFQEQAIKDAFFAGALATINVVDACSFGSDAEDIGKLLAFEHEVHGYHQQRCKDIDFKEKGRN